MENLYDKLRTYHLNILLKNELIGKTLWKVLNGEKAFIEDL